MSLPMRSAARLTSASNDWAWVVKSAVVVKVDDCLLEAQDEPKKASSWFEENKQSADSAFSEILLFDNPLELYLDVLIDYKIAETMGQNLLPNYPERDTAISSLEKEVVIY